MAMQINTNILSMAAQRNVGMNESRLGTAIERLSTGLRINSARDDAAGMAISERFTSQIRGQTVAQRNANDAISLSQTAEGALGVMSDALQRMRELTVQSLNGMNTDGDRAAIQQEIVQLREEIERIAQDTTFNGKNLLNGSMGTMNFQIGSERGDVLGISGLDARASILGEATSVVADSANSSIGYTGGPAALDITPAGGSAVGVDTSSVTDAKSLAAAINANETLRAAGVSADVGETYVNLGTLATSAGTLEINGKSVSVATSSRQATADAINSSGAGVEASIVGTDLVLRDISGGDIVVSESDDALLGASDYTTATTFSAGVTVSQKGGTAPTVEAVDEFGFGATGEPGSIAAPPIDEVSVTSVEDGNLALLSIDRAIDQVTSLRAELGAMQNRFENVVEVISVHRENLEAARSRIRDADFAAETANLTRAQILQQAGISSLAQANSAPQSVLSLLQ